MNWTQVLAEARLPEGAQEVVSVGTKAILLIRKDGEVFAVDNACPHLRLPLKGGRITEDCGLVCPWHHSAFDLRSGDVKDWSPWPPGLGAMLGRLSREKTLQTYSVKIEDGFISVEVS
jgi:nitrite reductase/ring-hydroxylating ferredoxin subunit